MATLSASAQAGIPFMITAAMKQRLRERGFSDTDIHNMTPKEANDILNGGLTMSTDDITTLRLALLQSGFTPLPCEGKRPPMAKWSERHSYTTEEIELWPKSYPYAENTGVLCRNTPTIDIDFMDPAAVGAIVDLAREVFEERGVILVRQGKAPKCAIPLRTDAPFKKMKTSLVAADGSTGSAVEILADGQQFIAAGMHPETRQPYRWHGGELTSVTHEDLPYVNEEQARDFLRRAEELLIADFNYKRTETPTSRAGNGGNGHQHHADWAALTHKIVHSIELHDSLRDLAASYAAHGIPPADTTRMLQSLMYAAAIPHDARWQERFDDIDRLVRSAYAKFHNDPQKPATPLKWLDMSNWDREPIPEREEAIPGRVPRKQAGLFTGEGGVGKSIIELQKDVAHVTGRDWLGSLPEQGPAFYIGAEDEEGELHRRLAAIAQHYGVTFEELIAGGLHILCLLGQDATLCAVSNGKSGKVEVTNLYRQIYNAAGDTKPKNISIDPVTRAFVGNEIDRVQVYGFAMHMQALAMVSGGSVTVLGHPSLQGMASGSGLSGSTAWHGAFRFRHFLTSASAKSTDGEQPDDGLRQLECKKNQYGPMPEAIVLRYQRGLFLPEPGVGSLERLAQEQRDDELFLAMLVNFEKQNRFVSDKPNAPNYAPRAFSEDPRANGVGKKRFAAAMNRLFAAEKIHLETYGRPSQPCSKIVAGACQ
jgi:RecA-family ATPase